MKAMNPNETPTPLTNKVHEEVVEYVKQHTEVRPFDAEKEKDGNWNYVSRIEVLLATKKIADHARDLEQKLTKAERLRFAADAGRRSDRHALETKLAQVTAERDASRQAHAATLSEMARRAASLKEVAAPVPSNGLETSQSAEVPQSQSS
jgi:hypothetical protein